MVSLHNPNSNSNSNSIDLPSADRPFDNIINFRDVGRTINAYLGGQMLKEGVLFRSARLDDASERDIRRLAEELHLSTVVDLRTETEHRMAARKYLAEHPDLSGSANGNTDTSDAPASAPTSSPPTSSDPQAKSHLLDIPRATRVMISLTGKSWERALLWRLDWMNFFKVLSLLATGYRIDAAKIIVQQVLVPRGLTGLATDTLDYSTVEMREVFGLLAGYRHPRHRRGPRSGSGSGPQQDGEEEEEDDDYGYYDYDYEVEYGDDSGDGEEKSTYPLLIHCTQGKDRTGLIIILLLLLLLSPTPTPTPKTTESQPQPQPPSTSPSVSTAITTDYTRSETELLPEADDRLKELFELGIPESFLKCPPEFTDAIRAYLHERYGGVRGYLDYIGVGRQMQEGIRRRLLC